jgi:undecaprenyl diphosphate synthase
LKERLPAHIGIIMDGNGRWAKMRGLPRIEGHRHGEESIMVTVRACVRLGIKYLSLFAFSTENWERPEEEVSFLVGMSRDMLRRRLEEFMGLGVRMHHVGRREGIPGPILAWFDRAAEATERNEALTLCINFNYGGRGEILDATARLAEKALRGEISPGDVDEDLLESHFYLPGLPDIDLLIRTAGEMRISNFMLWHCADALIYVSPVLWPDFREPHLLEAISYYRERSGLLDADY